MEHIIENATLCLHGYIDPDHILHGINSANMSGKCSQNTMKADVLSQDQYNYLRIM